MQGQWRFHFEPARWMLVARAFVALLILYWIDLAAEKEAAITAFIDLLLTELQRSLVTPNVKLTPATVEAARDVPPNAPV